MSSNTSPVRDALPHEVAEVIEAVRAFTEATEKVGADQFGDAATDLARPTLAWVLDRMDDAVTCMADLLREVAGTVACDEGDGYDIEEASVSLSSAGDLLRSVIAEVDPECDRHWLLHLYGGQPQVDADE